jgi:TonB-dependent SusC/RagA subfamily outer membrane receptor
MKKSILLSMVLLFVFSISSLAQTNKVLSLDKDKNVTTGNTSIINQDISSKKIQIKPYSFNTMNQNRFKPIMIIDGKISDHGSSGLDPNDIQSISVFKGEKATSLYGGINGAGVIIITTKKRANEIKVEKEPD